MGDGLTPPACDGAAGVPEPQYTFQTEARSERPPFLVRQLTAPSAHGHPQERGEADT